MKYAVVLEKTDTGFSAYAPDVGGCIATGATERETLERMREALEFHFEGMREAGLPIPEPSTHVDYVEVAA